MEHHDGLGRGAVAHDLEPVFILKLVQHPNHPRPHVEHVRLILHIEPPVAQSQRVFLVHRGYDRFVMRRDDALGVFLKRNQARGAVDGRQLKINHF